jgi:hypothetical protein
LGVGVVAADEFLEEGLLDAEICGNGIDVDDPEGIFD